MNILNDPGERFEYRTQWIYDRMEFLLMASQMIEERLMTAGLATTIEETGLRSVIRWLAQDREVTLFVNFRQAKTALPEWLSEKDDLYATAPQEVRDLYSLHAVGDRDLEELWKLADSLKNRDACVWLFSSLSRDELLKGLKLYLAWYARPSLLKMQFEQGSKELAKGLLTGVDVVVLQVPGDEEYHHFDNPEATIDWGQFESQR